MARINRRTAFLLFVSAALAAIALIYVVRLPLAGWVLRQSLAYYGVDAKLSVTTLGHDRMTVENLAIGDKSELTADSIEVRFGLEQAFGSQVHAAEISGMSLRLNLTGDKPRIEGLPDIPTTSDSGPSMTGYRLPTITVRESELLATTPIGKIETFYSAEIRPEDRGALSLSGDLHSIASDLGQLSASLNATLEPNNLLLGEFLIADGRMALPEADVTGLKGQLTYQLKTDDPSTLVADAAFRAMSLVLLNPDLPISDFRETQISIQIDHGRAQVMADLETDDGSLQGASRISLADFWNGGALNGEGSVLFTAPSPLPAALGLPGPDGGSLALEFSLTGETPPISETARGTSETVSRILAHGLALTGKATARELRVPEWIATANAQIAVSGTLKNDRIDVATTTPATIHASGLTEETLAELGLPPTAAALIGDGLAATIGSAQEPASLSFTLNDGQVQAEGEILFNSLDKNIEAISKVRLAAKQGTIDDISLTGLEARVSELHLSDYRLSDLGLDGEASGHPNDLKANLALKGRIGKTTFGAFSIDEARFDLPFNAGVTDQRIRLAVKPGANAVVSNALGPRGLTSKDPLRIALEDVVAEIPRGETGDLRIEGGLNLGRTVLQAPNEDPPIEIAVAPIAMTFSGAGTAGGVPLVDGNFRSDALTTTGYETDLTGITGSYRFDSNTGRLSGGFDVQEVVVQALSGLVHPFAVNGSIKRFEDGRLELQGAPVWPEDTRPFSITGDLHPPSETGTLQATLAPVELRPEGLQPETITPLAAHFEKVVGLLAAQARFSWQGPHIESSGALSIENGGFNSSGVEARSLASAITFKSLWPLETPPSQRLALERLDVGVPVTNLEVVFALKTDESGAPLMALEDAKFELFGGSIKLNPQEIDFKAKKNSVLVEVLGLDLGELFAFADVEGVAGSGQLDGSIPMVITEGGIAVEGGRFANTGPGRLHIRSETARAYLANYDENVDLLMEALEDFQYETLTLEVDKTANEDLIAKLSILGRNPDVLEGHPFQLNVRLDSNIARLMEAMIEGYRISNEALRRAWNLAR